MDRKEYLKIEYEQTIQTLRNWDSLFFNAFVSIFIGGGISSLVAFLGKDDVKISQIKTVLIAFVSCVYLLVSLYFLYNIFVAQKKFKVIREIESDLEMVGAYKENTGKIKSFLNFLIFPILTIIYTAALLFIINEIK